MTFSQSNRIVDEKVDGVDPYPTGGNYNYDGAGRLTGARVAGATLYNYEFAATAACGTFTGAGKNSNRTRVLVNSVARDTFCYNDQDQLVSRSQAPTTLGYDAWGRTSSALGKTFSFDDANRHTQTVTGANVVGYKWDGIDRIVQRTTNAAGDTTTYPSYVSAGDTPSTSHRMVTG